VLDLKFSGIFAGIMFFLSLLIGFISRATMPMLIIRPLIFAVIFFVLSAVIKILISRFLPELLEGSAGGGSSRPGSRIDILEDDGASDSSAMAEGFVSGALGQVPAGARPDDSEDGLGDISELSRRISSSLDAGENTPAGESIPGIDQNEKESYTDNGGSSDSIAPDFSNMFSAGSSDAPAGGQAKAAGAGAKTPDSDDALPDLDSMAEVFMSGSPDDGQGASERSTPGLSRRSDKTPKWTEDFDAKEIAMGIRSVLKKDKEG
jgi:hypothetical protein